MKNSEELLSNFINPSKFQDPIPVDNYEADFLYELLFNMVQIRLAEEKLAKERELGNIGGPVHLSAGQEAIAVGISKNLNNEDRVFGAHRSHAHILSMNPDFHKLFAEVLGKETGFSKGMGGSMHLIDKEHGFYGSVPIVSGTVPLAVGAAFDAKRNGTNNIGLTYLGDGAVEEGVVQESLNLARVLPAPAIFVVENNLFASHMNISLRQPLRSTCRFAEANLIENEVIDGNNVIAVYEASKKFIENSRTSGLPGFLEAVTFRQYGHVDWRKDIDVGVDRSQQDIDEWIKRDPITRLFLGMLEASFLTTKDFEDMKIQISQEILEAWEKALQDPYPSSEKLLSRVYFDEN